LSKNYWQGKQIRLRALEDADLERYIAERAQPDSIRQWYEDELLFPASEKEVRKSYDEALEEFSKDDKRIFIIETRSGEYLGEISVWNTKKRAMVFRYGIFLVEDARGKRYGKEALTIVLDYYFNELNYQKCDPTVYSFNKKSQAFHESMGFILEGRLRNDVYTRGEYHDMLVYGMLKDEFNKLHKHEFPV